MNDQVTREETAEILRLAEQTLAQGARGDFVELGCYRGDTSVLLGKLLLDFGNKNRLTSKATSSDEKSNHTPNLWLYDSFAGLPEKTREDSSGAGANFQKGELFVTKREVVDKLRKHGLRTSNNLLAASPGASISDESAPGQPSQNFSVIVKKAWFNDLTSQDLPEKISFAFCDGDLYSSIKTSLRLIEKRLVKQGIIIVHDYNNPELPGSSKAVDEFLYAHPTYRLQVRHALAILQKASN